MIKLESHFRRKDQILTQTASDTQVLFNLDSGQYYSLNEVGSRLWQLCDGSCSVSEIISTLCDEFDASTEMIESDVLELLGELEGEALVVEKV
jgi:hypothetical protein